MVGDRSLVAVPELAGFAGREVRIGIRAENIAVDSEPRDGALRATVEVVEPTGAAVLLTVRLDGHPVKVMAPAGFRAEPDTPVWLSPQPAALRFYDPGSGVAIS